MRQIGWLPVRRRSARPVLRYRPELVPLESRVVPTVTLSTNFTGLNTYDLNQQALIEPPDTIGAAGPSTVIEIVNSNLAIYNKTTGALLSSTDVGSFFAPVDQDQFFYSDVIVLYDDQASRFFVATMDLDFDTLTAYYDFAISNNANPTNLSSDFTEMHQIETDEISDRTGVGLFTDFPRVGFNADAYVVTFNMYDFDTMSVPYGVQMVTIKKSSVLDQNPSTLTTFQLDRPLPNSTMVPATMHGTQAGGPMWFVEEKGPEQDGTNLYLRLVKETNVLSATPTFQDYYVAITPYTIPPFPTDPTAVITEAVDTRILCADWRNGRLVAAHTVGLDSDFVDHARWYDINTNSPTPTLLQEGDISRGATTDAYMPSIAISPNGALGMTFIESGDSENMSMYVTGQSPTDAAGTMQAPVRAKAGEDGYQGTRAGDFSSTMVDPSDPNSFWSANEYAVLAQNPGDANWGTWIAKFSVSGSGTFSAAISGASDGVPFQPRTFVLSTRDPRPNDQTSLFTYNIDWGDGVTQTLADYSPSTAIHDYAAAGTYTVTVTATDQDGFTSTAATRTVTIKNAELQGGVLAAGATANNDGFTLSPGTTQGSWKVVRNGTTLGTFTPTASVQLYGGDGTDTFTLNGTSGNDSFQIDPLDVVLNGLVFQGNSIETWKVFGQAGNDTFTVTPGSKSTVNGGTGTNTLIGPNVPNVWNLGGTNAGNLNGTTTFTLIQNLTGGIVSDAFKLSGSSTFSGTLDGGFGTNTLNFSGYGSAVTVNLQTKTAPGMAGFTNIASVIGSAATTDTLIGPDSGVTWQLTGANSGRAGGTSFQAFENLTGGSGVDTFKISPGGTLSGVLNGGGNGDWLDYSLFTTGVTVNLATGQATNLTGGITGIENVTGGSGNDSFTGNSQGNILQGGSGNDTLTGGSGRSLLIGGTGSDSITGGTGDDILISGTTTFDTNHAALQSILAEWQRTDRDYNTRISDLRNGGGLNGSNKLIWGTTVLDDAAADTLQGDPPPPATAGLDWFFANQSGGVLDTIVDLNNGGTEQVN
jgi:Ca2+-binding RTX toxin-like protein